MTATLATALSTTPATDAANTATLAVADYRTALATGALVVDIRSTAQRERQGVLSGAVAVTGGPVVDLLDPGTDTPLAAVRGGRPLVLVSDDGLDAEVVAWQLRARGVAGACALAGGYAALRAGGALGLLHHAAHLVRERSAIAAH